MLVPRASYFFPAFLLTSSLFSPFRGRGWASSFEGYFSQEKTGELYSRASLRTRHRLILLTTDSHGSTGAVLGLRWCRSPTWPPKQHTGSSLGFTFFS